MTITSKAASAIAVGALLAAGVAPFMALATSTEEADCKLQAGITANVGTSTVTVAQLITLGDCRINARNVRLNAAITRVSQMNHLSTSIKSDLQATLSGTENTLGTIKNKLDHDTDKATALTDYRSIFRSVRVYALVLPRTWIVAAADRAEDTASKLQQVSILLQARNGTFASTTLQAANSALIQDLNTNLVNAQANAAAAVTLVMPLVPDQGDEAVSTSNKAKLETAQMKVAAARVNLQTAVDDVAKIRANFKLVP